MKIANLTQHNSTKEQQEAGVVDLIERQDEIKILLTFDEIPSKKEMEPYIKRGTWQCITTIDHNKKGII